MAPPDTKTPAWGAGVSQCTLDAKHDSEGAAIVQAIPPARPARRLPAYGREVEANLRAGRRPAFGGGTVAVTPEWRWEPPLVRVVCPPEVPADCWRFDFLRGAEVVVFAYARNAGYAVALRHALLAAGCSIAALAIAPDDDHE